MAAGLKPKANPEKERPFAWFCLSRRSPTPLSHKRNSKRFDQLESGAALSPHDKIFPIRCQTFGTHHRAWAERERFGAVDDQRSGSNLSLSNLFQVVRRLHQS